MQRNDSTSRPRLCSDTVVLRSSTAYKYLRWSNDKRFFGLFQPNQLRLRNIVQRFGDECVARATTNKGYEKKWNFFFRCRCCCCCCVCCCYSETQRTPEPRSRFFGEGHSNSHMLCEHPQQPNHPQITCIHSQSHHQHTHTLNRFSIPADKQQLRRRR